MAPSLGHWQHANVKRTVASESSAGAVIVRPTRLAKPCSSIKRYQYSWLGFRSVATKRHVQSESGPISAVPPASIFLNSGVVEISTTPEFKKILAGGTADIGPDSDWTCRFVATDLKPNHEYWYRFIDEHGFASRVGRTITAPNDDSDATVRFTFACCQCPNEGAMNAYRRMIFEDEARAKEERLNFVLHLGDFIFEVTW